MTRSKTLVSVLPIRVSSVSRRVCIWIAAALAVACVSSFASGLAADLRLRVQLVWGTDMSQPKATKYEPLDPLFQKKLARVFKWKNYFRIHEQKLTLSPADGQKRVKLSSKCEIEFRHADDSTLEIKLFGEGRWTKTVRQAIKALEQGELAVLAGDDKDNYSDAWFVVISAPGHEPR